VSRKFRVGVFIAASLLILATGIFLIGSNDMRFHSTYEIKTRFQNVAGLQAGAEVRVGGIHAGTVKHIDLPGQPDGEVTVVMDLAQSTLRIVNRGSVASVHSEGLLGDKYLDVSFGTKDGGAVRDGDTIGSVPPIDISDLVKQANEVLATTNDALGDVKATTRDLADVTSKIDQGKGTVGALINDQSLYKRVDAGATAFQEDMEALKHNFLLSGFFKRRGYEDSTELSRHRIARLPAGSELAYYPFDDSRLFGGPDSTKLHDQKSLNKAGEFLENNPFGLVVVVASEGPIGDSDKDRTLSEAKAMVVRDYLVAHFRFDDKRVKTLPLGKTEGPGDSAKVEIIAYPTALRQETSYNRR